MVVAAKYSDYSNVFSIQNIVELPKITGINGHAIELEKSKQSSFRAIYSLGRVELEILKMYIKISPSNGFIESLKSLAGATIIFD